MAKKILVADDSRVFRTLEEAFLAQRGYTVVHAGDGVTALRMAIDEKPDLILLDIQMPKMDGASVLSALKRNEATRSIPVIVITTIGRDKDREILLKAGADEFLSKPIKGGELIVKVHHLIGRADATSSP